MSALRRMIDRGEVRVLRLGTKLIRVAVSEVERIESSSGIRG